MDPLTLLREYISTHKPIEDRGDALVFGEWKASKEVPTTCRSASGAFYTLGALWFLVRRAYGSGEYAIEAKVQANDYAVLQKRGKELGNGALSLFWTIFPFTPCTSHDTEIRYACNTHVHKCIRGRAYVYICTHLH